MKIKYSFLYKPILSSCFFVSICIILPYVFGHVAQVMWPDNSRKIRDDCFFSYPFSRLTQVSPLMDDSSLMPFKLIFASRSYSRHGSFYRHVQLFWLVTGKNLRLLSNLRDYWVLVHTISSILLMLVTCVIRDLAPEQEATGKKRGGRFNLH